MVKKAYIITDLGPGDGGKGGVVQKITAMMSAHTVLKVGGAQGSHGVCTARGERFAFSQWGCGTFEGVKTHLSSRMVISPVGLLAEADALRYEHGIHDAFGLLSVDREALCATPYHGIASRLKEMARGNDPRGTIGTGVGEAYRYSQKHPSLTIRARDLSRPDLKDLLAGVREQVSRELAAMERKFLPGDLADVERETAHLRDDGFLDYTVERFREVSRRTAIVDREYLEREILSRDGALVVESSHGVLTDHYCGFHPHTSAIRTLPRFAQAMLRKDGYDGEIVNVGVFRAYAIRHGAGPLPTADPAMAESLLPGSHKDENRYQGKVRVGSLDLVLLRYAIEVCGGPKAFNGLAVTWFDQIMANRRWEMCDRYNGADDPRYFTREGTIKVEGGEDEEQLEYQELLGKQVSACKPAITTLKIPSKAGRDELYSFCSNVLGGKLGVPVRMVSFGPSESDKVCK